jgi:hypothetical protein
MTLWALAKSPLMYGGDMRKIDPATYEIIMNPTVLEINYFSSNNMEACEPSYFFFLEENSLHVRDKHIKIISFLLQWQFPYVTSSKNSKNEYQHHIQKMRRSKKGKKPIHSLGLTSCSESKAIGWTIENINQDLERICWKGNAENKHQNPFCVHKRELQFRL